MFNKHYINIVEKTSGTPPENLDIDSNNPDEIIKTILKKYENHPSILKIQQTFSSSDIFNFPKAEVPDINALIKNLNPKKETGPDTIPPKLARMSADVIDKNLCNVLNLDLENFIVPDNTKVATVRPIYKKKSRNEIENYRPVSLLNVFF